MSHNQPRSSFPSITRRFRLHTRWAAVACVVSAIAAPAAIAGDPQLGPIRFLPGDEEVGPAIQDQEHVRVEAGGPGYLAIWTDERAVLNGQTNAPEWETSGNQLDIYGQLLDPDGQPIGPPIVIANAGRNQEHADLAWNESAQAWMVAFQSQEPDWYFAQHVYGVRVAADGTVLDPDPVLLVEYADGQYAYYAAVASDGNDWLVIAQQWFNSQRTIRGRRIAADGTVIDPQPVVMLQNSSLIYPDISFANGVYLAVYMDVSQGRVWGQRFDTDLNLLGSQFLIGPGLSVSEANGPRVASNGNRFFVVGTHGHRIRSDGTNLDSSGIDLGGSATAAYMDVAWTGNEWVASMALTINFTHIGVYAQRIANNGALIDQDPILVEDVSSGWPQRKTAVGGRDGESQIGYSYRRISSAQEIRSAHLESTGDVTGLQTISLGMPRQAFVEIVHGPGNELLAVFLSDVAGESRLMTQRITQSGEPIDSEPTVVQTGAFISTPHVAWNGNVYLVVWSQSNNIIFGKRLNADNEVIDLNALLVANNPPSGDGYSAGAVGAAGDVFVVGLFHLIRFHEPVRYVEFVRVNGTTGAVLDDEPVLVAGGHSREMTGDSFADKAILAWAQYGTHDSPSAYTQAVIVGANGSRTSAFPVSAERGKEPDIAIDGEGEKALVVWHDDTTIHQDDIEGRFVFSDGTMPAGEFDISNATNEQMFPAAGWDGEQFVVAWNDYRHIDGVQQARSDIWLSRVTLDGVVLDPSGVQVTDSPLPEDLPAVGGGGGTAVIMFSMLHGLGEVPEIQRLAYRVLGDPGQVATLTDMTVSFGTLLDGDLEDLRFSDDQFVHTQSQFGFQIQEPHLMAVDVGADSDVASPSSIDLAAEWRLTPGTGAGILQLKDWSTGQWVEVHRSSIGGTEQRVTVSGIDAENFVRSSDGRVEVRVKHVVQFAFSALGFESYIDHVEVTVR